MFGVVEYTIHLPILPSLAKNNYVAPFVTLASSENLKNIYIVLYLQHNILDKKVSGSWQLI